jgi:hypothetical protein
MAVTCRRHAAANASGSACIWSCKSMTRSDRSAAADARKYGIISGLPKAARCPTIHTVRPTSRGFMHRP